MMADPEQQLRHAAKMAERQRSLLSQYAAERVQALSRRAVIYTLGAILIVLATGPVLGLGATAILLLGEAVDMAVLRRVPARLERGESYAKVARASLLGGVTQALTMAIASTLYVVVEGADSSIMGVVGVLGMSTVNAALILPTNPRLAMIKMGLFMATPIFLVILQAVRLGGDMAVLQLDMAELMVILSMAYMCYSFARAGIDNFKKTEALRRSQLNLSVANETLGKNRHEMLRLSMVARKTNDAVILLDAEHKIEWVNEAFTQMTGIDEDAVKGFRLPQLIAATNADPKAQTDVEAAMDAGKAHKIEVRHDVADGRVRWAETQILPVKDADDNVDFFVAIVRDITTRKEHDDSMRRARNAALDAVQAKADFLANMSHEIRTPMTGIIGMADLLSETEQSQEQSEYTQTIIGSSRSLLTIINDILDLSKLDAGKLKITNSTFQLRECFEETFRLLEPNARNKGLALTLTVAEDVPTYLFADDVRIRQIATNIIGNATKFTEAGRIDVKVWMERARETNTKAPLTLHFTVQDTGIGIPEDQLSTIFDEFTQAESSTTRRFGGTGLGLTICRILTDMMGGEITASSVFGEGSTFHVSLPVDLPEQDALPKPHKLPSQPDVSYDALDLAGIEVLVAEDNKTNRLLIGKFLEPLPINLRFATDGYEAVEATLENPPDLIFMDMSMPNIDGLEATETIRNSEVRQPRIVALTANAFENERQACLKAGMDDFLTKPIRRNDLVECLQRHVGRRNGLTSAVQSAMEA